MSWQFFFINFYKFPTNSNETEINESTRLEFGDVLNLKIMNVNAKIPIK